MIITLAVRVLQILFAVVVLALSVVLIRGMGPVFEGHTVQKVPSLIDYGAFCGGAGIVIAVFGVVAAFFEPLQGIIIMALDALASFFVLAGGIVSAFILLELAYTNGTAGICSYNQGWNMRRYHLHSRQFKDFRAV
jgi:cytochrome bd-type quinol oxidase subunit 2